MLQFPLNPKDRIKAMLEISKGNAVEFLLNGKTQRITPHGHDPRFYQTIWIGETDVKLSK